MEGRESAAETNGDVAAVLRGEPRRDYWGRLKSGRSGGMCSEPGQGKHWLHRGVTEGPAGSGACRFHWFSFIHSAASICSAFVPLSLGLLRHTHAHTHTHTHTHTCTEMYTSPCFLSLSLSLCWNGYCVHDRCASFQ